jgi:DHA2 family integral membrane protein (MFS transporter)
MSSNTTAAPRSTAPAAAPRLRPGSDPESIRDRRWAILGVLVLCLLVVILDNSILNVALKTIQQDLGTSLSQMQWAVDSYALVFAGLLIPAGVLGDRWGRQRFLFIGMITFGATSALCSFATSSTSLIVFRALMGIGAAMVMPQTLSIIQNVFEPAERPKAIGIWGGASGAAIALGPITGGLLLKFFWWGSIFLVNVPIAIIGAILIWWLVPESKDPRPHRLDPVGIVLSIVAVFVLVYGVIEGGNSNDWLAWNTLGAVLVGVALLALFVWLQIRSDHPTIDMTLFKNRHFSAGVATISVTFFAMMGATFYLAYYLQAIRGYSPLLAGTCLVAMAVTVMVTAPMSAQLSPRFGPNIVTGSGQLLFAITMGCYILATQHMPVWVIELLMVGMGIGMGLTMAPASNAVMSAVPREKAGAGSAVNNTVRQVAAALGVAILGSLLSVVFQSHLGADASKNAAAKLDQPAAIVQQLPASAQVSSVVTADDTKSIGNAYEFALSAQDALQKRAALLDGKVTQQQMENAKAGARQTLGGFVGDSKSAFMTAVHVTTVIAALALLLGSLIAFRFFPTRAEFRALSRHGHGQAPVAME